MCGLTGFWAFNSIASQELLALASKMGAAIQARGPDSAGEWCDATTGLAFAHRRLAIVDLSEAGHQPMISRSGRSVIIYNGELYNSDDLRKTLEQEGCTFRGYSDTEVLLEACEHWGVQKAVEQCLGMFAFALWRTDLKQLFLVRDRVGIKPLYWGFHEGTLFFGSQIKSFMEHPHFRPKLNKAALSAYFRFNNIPAPQSIFEGIQQLSPGMVLSIDTQKNVQQNRFWNFETVVREGIAKTTSQSDVENVQALDDLLRDAVKRRMIADVPLGGFLSGGIDSSLVLALMQSQSAVPIKSFSIGFDEPGYNEAPYAEAVAKHLGTDHQSLYLKSQDAIKIIPEIPTYFDEPFADVSQIPTFLVSKLAREKVIVSLSGDGGDELFAGYNRYLQGHCIWKTIAWMPKPIKTLLGSMIHRISPELWDRLACVLPTFLRPALLGDRIHKLAKILEAQDLPAFYGLLLSHWDHPEQIVLGSTEQEADFWQRADDLSFRHPTESMQFFDTLGYLPDDILTKVDRASMAVSLEARVPLLDHRVVAFAWQLPYHMKVRDGQGKWILRQVLDRYVPRALVDRPKMGFGVPLDAWLRGPLREWAEDLLSEKTLKEQGILNPKPIRARWQEHLSSKRNWQYSLWGVLMFQAWYTQYEKKISL